VSTLHEERTRPEMEHYSLPALPMPGAHIASVRRVGDKRWTGLRRHVKRRTPLSSHGRYSLDQLGLGLPGLGLEGTCGLYGDGT
jgi:hypothetical protein